MSCFGPLHEIVNSAQRLRYWSGVSIRKTHRNEAPFCRIITLSSKCNKHTVYFHATATALICASTCVCLILMRAFMSLLKKSLMGLLRTCLQEFHYHPRGSDTCLPCDCYPVGSFSRSCDPESGQCQCRPGVIGRQCNACDNPFAEVTNSGCEGETAFCYHNGCTSLIRRWRRICVC